MAKLDLGETEVRGWVEGWKVTGILAVVSVQTLDVMIVSERRLDVVCCGGALLIRVLVAAELDSTCTADKSCASAPLWILAYE